MTERVSLPPSELEAALRAGDDCPPIERLAAAALGDPAESDSAAILAHAERCAACAAEVELARSFGAATPAADLAAVDAVVATLRREAPAGRVLTFERRRRGAGGAGGRRLAAAAAVAAAAGLAYIVGGRALPPALPSPPIEDVARGARVEVVEGSGELAAPPERIVWRAIAGAATYEVSVVGVDDEPVLVRRASSPSVELTAAERALLESRVAWRLRVAARDARGAVVADSGYLPLRIR